MEVVATCKNRSLFFRYRIAFPYAEIRTHVCVSACGHDETCLGFWRGFTEKMLVFLYSKEWWAGLDSNQ